METGNALSDLDHIRGIIRVWGGILVTAFIAPGESQKVPSSLIQSQSDEVIPYQHSRGQKYVFSPLYGSFDIAKRFETNGSCARLYYSRDARHSFGFSHSYVVSAIKSFVENVLKNNCKSSVEENTNGQNDLPFPVYQ
jgi:hypothetical protein